MVALIYNFWQTYFIDCTVSYRHYLLTPHSSQLAVRGHKSQKRIRSTALESCFRCTETQYFKGHQEYYISTTEYLFTLNQSVPHFLTLIAACVVNSNKY